MPVQLKMQLIVGCVGVEEMMTKSDLIVISKVEKTIEELLDQRFWLKSMGVVDAVTYVLLTAKTIYTRVVLATQLLQWFQFFIRIYFWSIALGSGTRNVQSVWLRSQPISSNAHGPLNSTGKHPNLLMNATHGHGY